MEKEMRLIDVNGKQTINAVDLTGFILCFSDGIISVIDRFGSVACEFYAEDIPTVDAVEVVRCKDCKKWNEETGFCDEHSQFYEHGMYWDIFAEEDFCSYGERKEA